MTAHDGSYAAEAPPRGFAPRVSLDALRDYGVLISLVALFVALSIASSAFLTQTNLLNILDQQADLGIIACGATLVIVAGGLDLSVAAIFALAGVMACKVANETGPLLGILAGCGVGLGVGVLNGLLVTVGRMNSFIATLAMSIIVGGVALAVTGGSQVIVEDDSFRFFPQDALVSGLTRASVALVIVVTVAWFVLARTTFGRYVYAVGGNAEAARLSGIRVNVVRGATFALSGLGAGLAGVIVASRVSSATADAGAGLELTAIAAVVIGGTSIAGGEGAIWRTVVGVLFLALVGNGFNLLGVDPLYERVVTGALIVLAVSIDAWARRRRS
ncbi:MAG: ABC transporter permease [Actinobacteria bacterium]|nr:ABC transporter permease [Actinomycetota bacterium]